MASHTINFKSPHWRDRVNEFRRAFVDDYLKPQLPYPFFNAVTLAHIEPTSNSAIRLLRDRDPLAVEGGQLVGSGPDVQLPFDLTLMEHKVNVELCLPSLLRINASYDATRLALNFITSLGVLFVIKPIWGEIQDYRFAPFQHLNRVTMSAASLDFELLDGTIPGQITTVSFDLSP